MNNPYSNPVKTCKKCKKYPCICSTKVIQSINNICLESRFLQYQVLSVIVPVGQAVHGQPDIAPSTPYQNPNGLTYDRHWKLEVPAVPINAVLLRAYATHDDSDITLWNYYDGNESPSYYFLVQKNQLSEFVIIFPVSNINLVMITNALLDTNVSPPITQEEIRILFILV